MKKDSIQLSKEQKELLTSRLERYYFDNYHENLGVIGAVNLINFFMEECAPLIYNLALRDAKFAVERQASSMLEEIDVLEKRM